MDLQELGNKGEERRGENEDGEEGCVSEDQERSKQKGGEEESQLGKMRGGKTELGKMMKKERRGKSGRGRRKDARTTEEQGR